LPARITEPGRRSKNGDVVSGEWIDSGYRRKGDRHVLHYGPSRRDTREGQGVMILKDGKMATWTANGVGTTKKDGTASFCGAVYYQTYPPRWSRLNKVAVVFEYEVDAQGNTRSDFWEWKKRGS